MLILSQGVLGITLSPDPGPKKIILENEKKTQLTYRVGHANDYPTKFTVAVEGSTSDFASISEKEFILDEGKIGTITIFFDLTAAPAGKYPFSVIVTEQPQNAEGIVSTTSGGDTRMIVNTAAQGKAVVTPAILRNKAQILIENIGTLGLTNVAVEASILQDGKIVVTQRFPNKIIKELDSALFEFSLPEFNDGEFVLIGSASSDQELPIAFSKKFSNGKPKINVSFPEKIESGKNKSIPSIWSLEWNEPVIIQYPKVYFNNGSKIVFSDMKDSLELKPGLTDLNFTGDVRVKQSENVTVFAAFDLSGKEQVRLSNIEITYIKPTVAETTYAFAAKQVETIKKSKNLQVLLLVVIAMIFSSCVTAIVLLKMEEAKGKHEKPNI